MSDVDKVIAIQVVPVIEDEGGGSVEVQLDGPTEETTGWGVYRRMEDGRASWVADVGQEADADITGQAFAAHHDVAIEDQSWKSGE